MVAMIFMCYFYSVLKIQFPLRRTGKAIDKTDPCRIYFDKKICQIIFDISVGPDT